MKRYRRAFTLLEVLIAAAIFTIIAASLYSVFRTGVFSYNTVAASFLTEQNARILLARIETDLKNSFPYSKANSRFQGDANHLSFFSVTDEYDRAGEVFLRVCRIDYGLSGNQLQRYCHQGLDALKDPGIAGPKGLSSSVKEISFAYAYPQTTLDPPYGWQDIWPKGDDQQSGEIPLAVKIKLVLVQKDRNSKGSDRMIEFDKTVFLHQGG